jgi:hypothetical protein
VLGIRGSSEEREGTEIFYIYNYEQREGVSAKILVPGSAPSLSQHPFVPSANECISQKSASRRNGQGESSIVARFFPATNVFDQLWTVCDRDGGKEKGTLGHHFYLAGSKGPPGQASKLEACAKAADTLLRTCPRVKILTTSREKLGVTGEQVYRVPALGVSEGARNRPHAHDSAGDGLRAE